MVIAPTPGAIAVSAKKRSNYIAEVFEWYIRSLYEWLHGHEYLVPIVQSWFAHRYELASPRRVAFEQVFQALGSINSKVNVNFELPKLQLSNPTLVRLHTFRNTRSLLVYHSSINGTDADSFYEV